MSTNFVEGDVLLYFNEKVVHVVILDKIDSNYFIVVVDEEKEYLYGRQINIKSLNDKYFIKLDHVGKIDSSSPWLRYDS